MQTHQSRYVIQEFANPNEQGSHSPNEAVARIRSSWRCRTRVEVNSALGFDDRTTWDMQAFQAGNFSLFHGMVTWI